MFPCTLPLWAKCQSPCHLAAWKVIGGSLSRSSCQPPIASEQESTRPEHILQLNAQLERESADGSPVFPAQESSGPNEFDKLGQGAFNSRASSSCPVAALSTVHFRCLSRNKNPLLMLSSVSNSGSAWSAFSRISNSNRSWPTHFPSFSTKMMDCCTGTR